MRGYPKHINTLHDLDVALEIDATKAKAEVQRWIDENNVWAVSAKLDLTDTGTTDDTHKVVDITDEDGTVTEKYQYELTEDPRGRLARIGLSVTGATDIVEGN